MWIEKVKSFLRKPVCVPTPPTHLRRAVECDRCGLLHAYHPCPRCGSYLFQPIPFYVHPRKRRAA